MRIPGRGTASPEIDRPRLHRPHDICTSPCPLMNTTALTRIAEDAMQVRAAPAGQAHIEHQAGGRVGQFAAEVLRGRDVWTARPTERITSVRVARMDVVVDDEDYRLLVGQKRTPADWARAASGGATSLRPLHASRPNGAAATGASHFCLSKRYAGKARTAIDRWQDQRPPTDGTAPPFIFTRYTLVLVAGRGCAAPADGVTPGLVGAPSSESDIARRRPREHARLRPSIPTYAPWI